MILIEIPQMTLVHASEELEVLQTTSDKETRLRIEGALETLKWIESKNHSGSELCNLLRN